MQMARKSRGSSKMGELHGAADDIWMPLRAVLRAARNGSTPDASAKPSARAAASIALTASGDATAADRLRVVARAMASPRLRIAVEQVSAAKNDDVLAQALEALEDAEHVDALVVPQRLRPGAP
jgi:hypothetical protein